ncbi:hypothetical protein ES705_16670 [subsurface metagenome]
MSKRGFGWLDKEISQMAQGAARVGVWAVVVMMLLTSVDIIARYFFNWPIYGAFELTSYLMVILVSLTLAYCAITKGHVRLEVGFPKRIQAVIDSIVTLLGLGFFSLITWQSAIQARVIQLSDAFSADLHVPVYYFVWVVFVGSALLSLVYLRDLIEYVTQAVRGKASTWVWLLVGSGIVLLLGVVMFWGKESLGHLEPFTAGLVGVGFLLLLLFLGLQVGLAIGLVGFLGMVYLSSNSAGLGVLATVPYRTFASYSMSIIPLFLLMGTFCFHSGLSVDLYQTMNCWLGRLPGGLAMATVGACAGFAAVSGSGMATAATFGKVALPEMKKYHYDDKLATGAVAAGGTIGILIPPSVILVIYGMLTDQSIGELFLAGFIPGVTEALFYVVTIYILCKHNPLLGPIGAKTTFIQKLYSLKSTWGVIALFGLVMGSIYLGICSPTEAAAVGALGAFLYALSRRKLSWQNFIDSIMDTGKTTAMIFLIITGTVIFAHFLAVTRLPIELASWAVGLEVNRYIIFGGIILIYLFLGAFMGAMGMILLTVPIFFPVVVSLGFNPIWFGIMVVRVCEMGAITPPVGVNVYVIHGVAKDIPLRTIFRGVVPFFIADMFHVGLLIAVPQVVLFLPSLIKV